VRDTATAVRTIDEVQTAPRLKFQRTADWLIEIQRPEAGGDWGSWPARIQDTAFVLLGLQRMEASDGRAQDVAVQRAIRWLLASQSDDGGWASFAPARSRFTAPKLEWIDQRSLTDATSPGTTGLVLDAICRYGLNGRDPSVRRGVQYLVGCQNLDGSWLGSWMGSYVGATCFAVQGLAAAGEDPSEPHLLRAGEWLRSVQNADGGWGEDPSGFHAGEYVAAASDAVQTARGLLGLIVSGDHSSDSVERGVQYLVDRQSESGDWPANGPTGTWQAGAFHVRCDLDRICYPLLALARYQAARGASREEK
jgi:squalene-hopene/tetraprenyl-beta-curcumene cyclase